MCVNVDIISLWLLWNINNCTTLRLKIVCLRLTIPFFFSQDHLLSKNTALKRRKISLKIFTIFRTYTSKIHFHIRFISLRLFHYLYDFDIGTNYGLFEKILWLSLFYFVLSLIRVVCMDNQWWCHFSNEIKYTKKRREVRENGH